MGLPGVEGAGQPGQGSSLRLFVAVYPPPEACHHVAEQASRLLIGSATAAGSNVRLAPTSSLHVTIAFIGLVEPALRCTVEDALARAARGSPAPGRRPRARLRLGGGGRFGEGRNTVLWVGLTGDVDALESLAVAVRRELSRADVPYDRRPFRAHLTLARPGDRLDPASVERDLRSLDGYLGPSWPVTELVLVRSHPGPRPRHERLASWPI